MPHLAALIYEWIFSMSGLLRGGHTQIMFNDLEGRYRKKLYPLDIYLVIRGILFSCLPAPECSH